MNDTVYLVFAFVAGIFLGLLFFGGLWWTVRKGLKSHTPALWFLGSMLLRTGITLAGFYFAGFGHWERFLVCLVGFVMARFGVIRFFPSSVESQEYNLTKVMCEFKS